MSPGSGVVLPSAVRRAIVAHAREAHPAECCGLLVGGGRRVDFAVRMQNVSGSPTRYRLDDRAHIELRKTLRAFRPPLAIVGVYHSHPDGTAEPSPTDVAESHYAEWVHVIVGTRAGRSVLCAYTITDGHSHRLVVTRGNHLK